MTGAHPGPVIAAEVLARAREVQADFVDDRTLSGFTVVDGFLAADAVAAADAAIGEAQWATYCGYLPTDRPGDLRREFHQPADDGVYMTVHERPLEAIPALEDLRVRLSAPSVLEQLGGLTGLELRRASVVFPLSAWGPGSFFQPHTDMSREDEPYQLLVSLSLTRGWRSDVGGDAVFAWGGHRRTIPPRHNTAVLFTPTEGSVHWVEKIADAAPAHTRLTWTMTYH